MRAKVKPKAKSAPHRLCDDDGDGGVVVVVVVMIFL